MRQNHSVRGYEALNFIPKTQALCQLVLHYRFNHVRRLETSNLICLYL